MTQANPSILLSQVQNGILILTLNRAERKNALNHELKVALTGKLQEAQADPRVKAVILTGSGRDVFCAGQDLQEIAYLPKEQIETEIAALYRTAYSFPKPLVAAVNGAATGGGFMLALSCDFRIAVPGCRFAMPEINVALPCVNGATILFELIGGAKTADLVLRGRFLNSEEALQWGLLTEVVLPGELLEKAVILAEELGMKSPAAYEVNKRWLRLLAGEYWEKAAAFFPKAYAEMERTGEPQRYIQMFLQKKG